MLPRGLLLIGQGRAGQEVSVVTDEVFESLFDGALVLFDLFYLYGMETPGLGQAPPDCAPVLVGERTRELLQSQRGGEDLHSIGIDHCGFDPIDVGETDNRGPFSQSILVGPNSGKLEVRFF